MSESTAKDTIYIDPEDEITAIIDKVRSSKSNIVALVLPKRAPTMQSIVNLRLLKRTAKNAKKSLVLITNEVGLLPIAGVAGLHVAKTLQSKPVIPDAPKHNDEFITINDGNSGTEDVEIDQNTTVGQLAGHLATEETIDLDNDVPAKKTVKPVTGINKKLKVPNFDKFRLVLFGGIGLVVLILFVFIYGLVILPKAKVVIKTDSANITTDLILTAKTDAKSLDETQLIVPAINKEIKKTDIIKTPATGQRNDGTKATGTMTLTNCINDGQPHTVPAGTGFSSGQYTFLTDSAVTLEPALYAASTCKSASLGLSKSVPVTAAQAGDNYNLGSRGYTSPASMTTSNGSITASGSNMTGGTSKITLIVSQQDIDNAKQKIIDNLNTQATSELKSQFAKENVTIIPDTTNTGAVIVASTPNVNDVANEVSVSVTVTFTQMGVKQEYLKKLLENDIKKHIDNSKQTIQDNGLQSAVIRVLEKKLPNDAKFNIQTLAVAGPSLDSEGIKKQIVGKRKSDAQRIIQSRPGIKDVTITYSPFWVYSTPKSTKKITIIFEQNNVKK